MGLVAALSGPRATAMADSSSTVAQATVVPTDDTSAALNRIKKSWSWYVSRASGILAAILLAILILSGVGLLTGQTYRFLEPLPAWAAHRAFGVAFAATSLLHVAVLLFDKFIGFSVVDLLVPFAADYKPLAIGPLQLGSLYVALGIISLYVLAIIMISTHYWMNSRPKRWKLFHYGSYVIAAAVFVHGLGLGTDLKTGLAQILWISATGFVAIAVGLRLYRARTIGRSG